jgi:hypothetical protein
MPYSAWDVQEMEIYGSETSVMASDGTHDGSQPVGRTLVPAAARRRLHGQGALTLAAGRDRPGAGCPVR